MIIGITGKKQSGKDTVCSMIRYLSSLNQEDDSILGAKFSDFELYMESDIFDLREHLFQRKAYGDKLKEVVSLLFPMNGLDLSLQEWKSKNLPSPFNDKTYRQMLQMVGESFRGLDTDFWVKQLFVEYSEKENWILSDCRYYNEIDIAIDKSPMNYLVIKIKRFSTEVDNHKSEQDLDLSKYKNCVIIDNIYTIDELFNRVKLIYFDKILKNV